jgi:ParB family chromosome partitioning protein
VKIQRINPKDKSTSPKGGAFMPRTKITSPQTAGSLALAQDMSNHIVDPATAESVAVITKVFEQRKTSAKPKPTGTTTRKTKTVASAEDMSKHVVDDATVEAVAMAVNVFEKNLVAESTTVPSQPSQSEIITHIPLADLHPPEFCPFVVSDNESMTRLTDSIKEYGVREPGLARPRPDGGYELLIGGRRKRACELAELPTMPVIIRELDDDSSVIAMVDSNLEVRDRLLPSEKAWAYRIKMEALNHKGIKGDKLSAEIVAEQTGDSRNQIFRFIRLTELVITLLDKVDLSQLAFNPAVELSYLSQKEQIAVASEMEVCGIKPSLSQAKRLRKLKQNGKLTEKSIRTILGESKPKTSHHEKISNRFRKYFPADYTPRQMNDVISTLLKNWQNEQSAQGGTDTQSPNHEGVTA